MLGICNPPKPPMCPNVVSEETGWITSYMCGLQSFEKNYNKKHISSLVGRRIVRSVV